MANIDFKDTVLMIEKYILYYSQCLVNLRSYIMKKILQLSFVLLLIFGGVSFAQGVHNTVVNINTADQATLASVPWHEKTSGQANR